MKRDSGTSLLVFALAFQTKSGYHRYQRAARLQPLNPKQFPAIWLLLIRQVAQRSVRRRRFYHAVEESYSRGYQEEKDNLSIHPGELECSQIRREGVTDPICPVGEE